MALPPKSPSGQTYSFSFEVQRPKLAFAAGSLEPLSVQLGEVKAICDVLLQANISALDGLRRERVSDDDQNGPQTDYLPDKSVTNELAVLTPYEVNFRCFSKDLAAVLAGFANSPYALMVKSINVEPAPAEAVAGDQSTAAACSSRAGLSAAAAAGADPDAGGTEAFAGGRYGMAPRAPRPVPRATAGGDAARRTRRRWPPKNKGGLPTVLNEKQLKITLAWWW